MNYVRTIKSFILLTLVTLFIQSCNKDEYEVINGEEPIPTSQALKNLYDGKLASLTNVIPFDATTIWYRFSLWSTRNKFIRK
jgi:hypothetical protein